MQYFSPLVHDGGTIKTAKETLRDTSIVNLTRFFNSQFVSELIEDTITVYKNRLQRRDFLMKQTENTPRNMFSVPERAVTEESRLIAQFYNAESVAAFISEVTQEETRTLPWTGERYVINGLAQSDDTHGWHWDDYSYALVFIAKAPSVAQGGAVECIPDTFWNRENPNIQSILNSRESKIYHYEDGSFYLMKSDTTLHRVAPISDGAIRIAIAMSWCTEVDLSKDIDHQTVYELYGV